MTGRSKRRPSRTGSTWKVKTCGAVLEIYSKWSFPRRRSTSRDKTERCHASIQYSWACRMKSMPTGAAPPNASGPAFDSQKSHGYAKFGSASFAEGTSCPFINPSWFFSMPVRREAFSESVGGVGVVSGLPPTVAVLQSVMGLASAKLNSKRQKSSPMTSRNLPVERLLGIGSMLLTGTGKNVFKLRYFATLLDDCRR